MNPGTKNKIEPLLLSAAQAASLIGISRSYFYSLLSSNEITVRRVKLRNRVLFNRKDLERFVEDISR